MTSTDEALHVDAVVLAQSVLFWRRAAVRRALDPVLRRRCRRHARAAETRLVDLAIALEARLRREQAPGVFRGTAPVPKISVASASP